VRLLHTSDWHLGRSFHRVGMLGAQAAVLDSLVEVVRAERVDAVVVAGDVYDRALPGVDAVQVLDDALARLLATGASVLVTSGNHDSASRLGFGGRAMAGAGLHLRTRLGDLDTPVLLEDAHGPVALYGVPYLEPALAAEPLGTARTHAGVLGAALDRVRADLATRPAGTRSVVAAHAFVTAGAPGDPGGEPERSDSERSISVGGVESVPVGAFAGLDYTALGHLHGRQRLAEHVRYSGSPLAYSFSEAGHVKGSWLVELGARGVERVDLVPAPVPRALARLRGDLADLLGDAAHAGAEDAWCQVVLTDPVRPREPMEALRARFPHVLSLSFEPRGAGPAAVGYAERVRGLDDEGLCCSFVEHVRGQAPGEAERALLARAVEAGRVSTEAAQDLTVELPRDPAPVAEPAVAR
jgi:DNA repair protein SbcD/Mre11